MRTFLRDVRNLAGGNGMIVFLFGFYICVSALACLNAACRIAFVLLPTGIGAVIVLLRRRGLTKERYIALTLCAACVASGLFSLCYHDLYRGAYRQAVGETYTGEGTVMDVYAANVYGGIYLVRFTDDTHRLPYTILLTTDSANGWRLGERIRGSVTAVEWEEDDVFSAERYYGAKGAVLSCVTEDAVSVGALAQTPRLWFARWNARLSALLSAHIRDGGLSAAVFLGDRSTLAGTTKLWFRRLGIYHLLAVSGTHLGIIVAIAERILVKRHKKPKVRALWLILVCIFYMALTGFPASIKRAGSMYILAQLFRLRDADVRGVYALGLSAVGIVLLSPCAVWDIGLQLSVCAVAGCYLFLALLARHRNLYRILAGRRAVTPLGKRLRRLRFSAASSMAMTALVTMVLLPLSYFYFGEVSLVGFLANLLYIPAITVEICLTVAFLMLYPIRIAILPLAAVLEGYTKLLLLPARAVAGIRGVCVSLAYPGLWLWLLPLLALTFLLPFAPGGGQRENNLRGDKPSAGKSRRFYGVYGGVLALFLVYILVCRVVTASQNVIVYESDGKREGFVLQSAGRVAIIDVSDGTYSFTRKLTRTARSRYAVEIEGYCLTHYHKRHTASFARLCGDNIVYGLYLPAPQTDEEQSVYRSLVSTAAEYGVPVTTFSGQIHFGEIGTTVAPRVYLSRSTHPVTGVLFQKDTWTVAYGSSSWNEGDAVIPEWFASTDVLFFGAHSPVYKKPFTLERETEPYAIVWNGASAEFGASIPARYVLYDKEKLIVQMR